MNENKRNLPVLWQPQPDNIYHMDALTLARHIPAGMVKTVVTSPPYFGLRDYGHAGQWGLEDTPDLYIKRMVTLFREIRCALSDDGTVWLNLGDSYGFGKQLIGIPWRVALALQADGWILRSDIIWHKPNAMPESVKDRPTKAHEYIFLLSKSQRYYYDADAVAEPAIKGDANSGAKNYRVIGGKSFRTDETQSRDYDESVRNRRSVWTVSTKPFSGAHFAVFPPDLIEPCILAGSAPGDVVLDPFMGSGTTALVARRFNRKFLGSEINTEYHAMAQERLRTPYTIDMFSLELTA